MIRWMLVLLLIGTFGPAYCGNEDGASDLGVDYAYMSLITLSPDISAGHYLIDNRTGQAVNLSVSKLPFFIHLDDNERASLRLEIAVAYQRTTEVLELFSGPGENIDAEWDIFGFDFGTLLEYHLTDKLMFTPSLRLGFIRMFNYADYNGVLTGSLADSYDGVIFNWQTNASVLNAGLGLKYNWEIFGRASTLSADFYHAYIESFAESHSPVSFSESANMLDVRADIVFPIAFSQERDTFDLVWLGGINRFYGKNSHTLGFNISYRNGIGFEIPIRAKQKNRGYLRFSFELLWAENMEGWYATIGYKSN